MPEGVRASGIKRHFGIWVVLFRMSPFRRTHPSATLAGQIGPVASWQGPPLPHRVKIIFPFRFARK